jgi:PAS domain S-box-containing protein
VYLKVDTTYAAEKAAITRLFLFGSVAAILVTSIAIFLIFEFSIFTRIQSLLLLFKRVEGGDLTVRAAGRIVSDEIGILQNGLNSMVAKLQETITALQKSQKRYRAVVEDIPAMICRFLPDGTLTFASSEYGKYFRKNYEALPEQNFFQSMTEENRENIKDHFMSLTLENPLITYTQQVITTDGSLHWQQWTGRALFNEKGEITEYQALGKDVTDEILARNEKAELEKQLQKAQKMEAIGTLAGGIAHDFNNILGGIIGYTELVQDDVLPDTRTQHYLNQILKACHRAKDLIIQILTFSRQSPAERQPLRLSSIVKEALKLLKATLPDSIDIHYNLESPASTVLANPTQIHQTLMNLCTNAISAMNDTGGILEVDLREIDVTIDHTTLYPELQVGTYVKLSVSDTGPGMNNEILQRIFDPYFTTKTPYEGTGLGLSICLGIVENHGGTIAVQSSLGEGSTFTIFLPTIEQTASLQDENTPPDIHEGHGNARVLFVDDEAFLVEVGQEMLEQLGYEVVATTNSQEALGLFCSQSEKFDLVITDQTMPNMTGSELATKILHIKPDIPIILCTGFSEVITEEQAKALGIREFILKPISRQDMAQAIRKVLEDL